MLSNVAYWVGTVVVLLLLDRALLAAEARGWINYRRRGSSKPPSD